MCSDGSGAMKAVELEVVSLLLIRLVCRGVLEVVSLLLFRLVCDCGRYLLVLVLEVVFCVCCHGGDRSLG